MGPRMGRQFFKNVDFSVTYPLNRKIRQEQGQTDTYQAERREERSRMPEKGYADERGQKSKAVKYLGSTGSTWY